MGQRYNQISIEERCEIARLRTAGRSIRQIAAALDRSPSTVAREMKRNGSQNSQYRPGYADQQSRARRWTGSKLERNSSLRQKVLSGLARGWSPEQVAGRLARDNGKPVISHETIYRFIYAQIARTKDTPGVVICHGASPNVAGGVAKVEARPRLSPFAVLSKSGLSRPRTAGHQGTGRRT